MLKYTVFLLFPILAGALTYFGLPPENVGGRVALNTPKVEAQSDISSAGVSDTQKEVLVAESEHPHDDEQTGQIQIDDTKQVDDTKNGPKRRWIDKYIKNDSKVEPSDNNKNTKNVDPDTDNSGTEKNIYIWHEDGKDFSREDKLEAKEDEVVVFDHDDNISDMNSSPELADEEIIYYKLKDGILEEVDISSIGPENAPTPTKSHTQARYNKFPDIARSESERFTLSMKEANRIKQDEMRDRAYLSIVDYCDAQGLFHEAQHAMSKIKQVELRDTARSRIAIALARRGQTKPAFDLIDEVEVKELRDVMRLQLIESMIMPERLPAGMLPQ